MKRIPCWVTGVLCLASAAAPIPVRAAEPPVVTGLDLVSRHVLPEGQVRAAIGPLVGRPRSRGAIREGLDRLWALRLFSSVRVEEVPEAEGVRLRYLLERRPHVRTVRWEGQGALDPTDLAAAAGLAVGEGAEPERLERARRDLLALYRAEGFFGAQVEVETREDLATNARDVTFVLRPGERAVVGAVRITGAVRRPVAELTRALVLREGAGYRQRTVRERVGVLQERLRREGLFMAQVAIGEPVWDAAANRVALEVQIIEGPEVRVEFSGNSVLDEAALRARLTFAESGAVDPVEVRASVRQLEAAYREQGYHFIQISGSLDQEGEALVVRFQVEEGPQVTVEAVTFSGNEIVPARRLRQQVETRPRAFLRPGLFRQEILDRDLRVLLAFLRSEGFAEAAVGQAEVRFSEDRSRARLTIPIVEGPRLAVGAVAVEGQTVLTADEVLAALPLRPGEPWDPARAEEGRGIVLRLYARRGYHAARVAVETRPRDGAVDVTYRIVEEGSQTRIGRILIGGLILTRERVVLRELGFGPGDPFDPERLTEAQARLTALRLFEQVEVEPLRPPPTPFADVRITVREGRPWRLDIGLGYSTDEEGRAFLELGHDNLFGTGRSAALRQKVSGRGERSDLTYREPHLFGTLWQAEAGLVREHREEIGFEIERLGGSVGIHRELFAERITGLRAAVGYRFERVVRFRVSPELAVADVVPGSQLIARVTPALTLERRDDPLDPKRGSLHLLSVEGGGGPVGGEVDFVKGRLETHWFLDWLPPTVLALSARVGLATPFGDTPALAIEDRFFAGGSTTVRGFRKDRLGPRDAAGNPTGGDAQVILNAEWRFPIWGWLGGAVFVDSGAVTREVGDLGPGEFETAVGAGVRLRTPVGPIRADFGYLLAPFPGEDRWQLHVTVGHPF